MVYILKGKNKEYEMNIGLEIHCQVISYSKLFSGAPTSFGAESNTHVSFFDAGFPGQLPRINKFCVEQAIRTGLGLNAVINKKSVFARKHYFYADLPTGYQISQHTQPIVGEGYVDIINEDNESKRIRVERLHLEQDAGKLLHDLSPSLSFVDFNRAGVALMEIVSRPDISSPVEAGEYIKKVRSIVRYLGTCDGNMDEGSMRCDINISLREKGTNILGTRTETKNVNSVKFAIAAIEYESNRQLGVLESGGKIVQETRLFDAGSGVTRSMRSKENAIDYRYFPDPDILPLILEEGLVEKIRDSMPELGHQKKERFTVEFGLTSYDADVLTVDREVAEFYEVAVGASNSKDAKMIANWIISELFAVLNKDGIEISKSPVGAVEIALLIDLIKDGTISGKIAKDVFKIMVEGVEKNPLKIVEINGLKQVSDTSVIEKIIDDIIISSPENVAQYRGGKVQLFGWFVGQALKAMKGQGNPSVINEILKKKLG